MDLFLSTQPPSPADKSLPSMLPCKDFESLKLKDNEGTQTKYEREGNDGERNLPLKSSKGKISTKLQEKYSFCKKENTANTIACQNEIPCLHETFFQSKMNSLLNCFFKLIIGFHITSCCIILA